eukprot:TRINITY_DN6614_c0_g2_i2.p1 TRINITY_DN6614_c0_g2~~TRINITY_DN6614_c0_g2_i2.p1  ORF type:complete len:247 (+),score=67.49 TRINITY_DN6614_c0_g2_i2:325-1065(+)
MDDEEAGAEGRALESEDAADDDDEYEESRRPRKLRRHQDIGVGKMPRARGDGNRKAKEKKGGKENRRALTRGALKEDKLPAGRRKTSSEVGLDALASLDAKYGIPSAQPAILGVEESDEDDDEEWEAEGGALGERLQAAVSIPDSDDEDDEDWGGVDGDWSGSRPQEEESEGGGEGLVGRGQRQRRRKMRADKQRARARKRRNKRVAARDDCPSLQSPPAQRRIGTSCWRRWPGWQRTLSEKGSGS